MTSNQIADIVSESLRDWFKKEKWVRISSSGNIAGDCGTSKNKKNPDRCLPKAKAQSLTKGQRAATAAKKKKAGSKGKTIVKNTKKATVKKEAYEPGSIAPEDLYYSDKHGKLVAMDDVDYKYHDSLELVYKKGDEIEGPMDEGLWANINAKKKAGKKPSHGNSNAHKAAEKAGKALGKESANPQDGKSAPFGSGYKTIKMKLKKEDVKNLVVGLLHEMKSSMVTFGYDLDAIQDVVDHLRSNYKEGQDYELHIGRGDDLPNAITFPKGEFRDDYDLSDMLNAAQSDEDEYDAYTDNDLNEGKDDRCTELAKQKYDTWPSAYASGAVVRCRRGEIWKKK